MGELEGRHEMNQRKLTFHLLLLAALIPLLGGCRPSPEATPTPPPETAPTVTHMPTTSQPTVAYTPTTSPPTFTPDFCIGWNCTITGVVYAGAASPGSELAGVLVELFQYSNCSPTRGEQETITDEGGNFTFEVFLHDTDGFNFKVELEGYELAKTSFGGFDCLFCACQPVEIVVQFTQ